jgi:hypothetical protein
MNVQVAATLNGQLAWISDPIDGSRHDSHCLAEAAVLTGMDARNWVGDKGYVGNNMITPIKKPPHRDLLDWEKEFNTQVNKIRWIIEQVIAALRCFKWVTQCEDMYAGVGLVRLGSGSLAAVR